MTKDYFLPKSAPKVDVYPNASLVPVDKENLFITEFASTKNTWKGSLLWLFLYFSISEAITVVYMNKPSQFHLRFRGNLKI